MVAAGVKFDLIFFLCKISLWNNAGTICLAEPETILMTTETDFLLKSTPIMRGHGKVVAKLDLGWRDDGFKSAELLTVCFYRFWRPWPQTFTQRVRDSNPVRDNNPVRESNPYFPGKILQTSRYSNYMTPHTTWHRQSMQHQDIWQMLCTDQRGTVKSGNTTDYPVGEVVLAFIK